MPKPKEQNTSIKDFVSVMDKQIGKLKNVDPKCTLKESVNKDNMVKEANDNTKPLKPLNNKELAQHKVRTYQKYLLVKGMQQREAHWKETQVKNKKREQVSHKIRKVIEKKNYTMKT